MTKVIKTGLVLALLVAANVATAQQLGFEIKGEKERCLELLCEGRGDAQATPPAPQRDPEVDALKDRLDQIEAEKVRKASLPKGPGAFERASDAIKVAKDEIDGRIAELQRQIDDLVAKQPSGNELENALKPILVELAKLHEEDEKLRAALQQERDERMTQDDLLSDNDMAQSRRMDNHDRMFLAMHNSINDLVIESRPINLGFALTPTFLSTGDGTEIGVLGITPHLELPLMRSHFDLELELSALLTGDKQPFGAASRAALAYIFSKRGSVSLGFDLLFVGYDHAFKAQSALAMGDLGLKFSPIPQLDFGANVLLGVEQDRDRHSAFAYGGRFYLGVNPFK